MSVTQRSRPAPTKVTCAFENGRTSPQSISPPHERKPQPTLPTSFFISHLPQELRNEIYTHIFTSLPPFRITPDNITSILHHETQLLLSSAYFKSDVLPSLFYANSTFSFSCPKLLSQFATGEGRELAAKARIEYGDISRCNHTDWVFLLYQIFDKLKEVTFVVDAEWKKVSPVLFEQWWECVQDAVREASCSQVNGKRGGMGAGVLLQLECEDGSIRNRSVVI